MFKHKRMSDEEKMACHSGRLCVVGVAVAAGIVNGLGMLILALMAAHNNFGVPIVHIVGSVYKGFGPGVPGAFWGLLWGFVDAFIVGLIFAWIYNGISYCCKCCCRGFFCKSKDMKK